MEADALREVQQTLEELRWVSEQHKEGPGWEVSNNWLLLLCPLFYLFVHTTAVKELMKKKV